jgi:membrane-bound ClpP family serine protease
MGVVFGILLILAESYLVIFCTAFIGSYLFMLGLDLFIHTGLINAFLSIFDGNKNHVNVYIIRTPVYVLLAFVIVLTLASFGWQYYWNIVSRKTQFGVHIEKKKPEGGEKK